MANMSSYDFYLKDVWKVGDHRCFVLPSNPSSYGIWEKIKDPDNGQWLSHTLPYVQFMFVVIFVIWQFFHFFLKRLGMIRFTSYLLTGFVLGKTVLDKEEERRFFFRGDLKETVLGLSGSFGYAMFWFLMGVKMDMGLVLTTGKKASVIGLSSVLLSAFASSLIFQKKFLNLIHLEKEEGGIAWEVMVIYLLQCVSTFPVIGNLLFELKIQNSDLGRLTMSAAVISDLTSSILQAGLLLLMIYSNMEKEGPAALLHAAMVIGFVVFVVYVFRPAMLWVVRSTPEGRPVKDIYIYAILTLVFGSSTYATALKLFSFIGPFILGLAIPDGPPLGSAIVEKFEPAIFGTLVPFAVATSAVEMDINTLGTDRTRVLLVVTVLLLTFVVKLACTASPAILFRIPVRDSLALGLAMNHKGIFELGAYGLALSKGSIKKSTFTVATLYLLLNSIVIPSILRYLYDPSKIYSGYEKRNMMHLKPNSELRILTCIHRPEDISPMMNFLEASCPTKESPIVAYVLHLIELAGQAHPLFVSHQMQIRKFGNRSYSDNVIISFNRFQRDLWGLVTVNMFTSVTVPKTMHDDICIMALTNNTSLVVLPFHRTWSADGSTIISDSPMIRNLNKSILQLAPCSAGILVHRSSIGTKTVRDAESHGSPYQVCMLFLGGKDDREALTLAKRMAQDSRLSLTVVHLVPAGAAAKTGEFADWDAMLDYQELQDVKQNTVGEEYVIYAEEVLKDGAETPLALKSMTNEYDMFVVGRGNRRKSVLTEGLEEWSEFKELGVIGDLLTSSDVNSRASVLVVQQQQQMN